MTASRPLIRALGLAATLVMLTGVVAVIVEGDDGLPVASARVRVDGRATVVHLDGSTDRLSSGDVVRAGEEVRVEVGSVVLELADGGTLEGREGTDQIAATRVVVDAVPELIAGDLLMIGDPGLAVDAAGTLVAVDDEESAAKIGRGLAVTAGTYQGAVLIDSAGQRRAVPAFRQIGIASLGRPPAAPDPLELVASDAWDRRFLGGAIDLTRRLNNLSQFFSSELPADAVQGVALFRALLPELAAEPGLPGLLSGEPERPAGDVLVGAALVSLTRGGSLVERWRAVFDFRDEGAAWGLVALDRGLRDAAVLAVLDSMLGVVSQTPELASPSAPATIPTTAATTPTTTGEPSTPTTPPPPPPAPPPTDPPPTDPTVPTVPPPPDEDVPDLPLIDDVVQTVDDLLGGLLGPP